MFSRNASGAGIVTKSLTTVVSKFESEMPAATSPTRKRGLTV
jgi:hypothetical protein